MTIEESKRYNHKRAIEFGEKIKQEWYQTPEYQESLKQDAKDLVDGIMKIVNQ